MESVPFTGEPEGHEGQQLMAQFDAPAFIRRARGVREALDHLLTRCRAQREEWLGMAKIHLGQLHALSGDWTVLRPLLAGDDQLAVLELLRSSLQPQLRAPPAPTNSMSVLRNVLRELVSSLERFNARWQPYLEKVDRTVIDDLRDRYNRYYVLEKACALRSDVLARRGFVQMTPLTVAELAEHLPLLPVPKMAE